MSTSAIEPNTNHTTIVPAGPRAFFAGRCELPPGINQAYSIGYVPTKNGPKPRIVDSEASKQFKKDAVLLLSQGYHDWNIINAIKASKRKVPLRMEMTFYFKSMWKRDVDGGEKAVQDAVFQRLGLNDVLVVDLHISKEVDVDEPRVEVEVYCIIPSH